MRGFEEALSLAEDERDEEASFAIRKALIHVREKIKELEEERVKREELGQEEEEKEEEKEEEEELKRGVRKIAFCESDPNSEEDESEVKEKYEEDWDEEEEEEEQNTFHDVSDESSAEENLGSPTRSGDSTPKTQGSHSSRIPFIYIIPFTVSDPTELKIQDTEPIIVQNDSGSTSLSESGSIPDLQERPESFRGNSSRSRPESTHNMKRPQSSMSRGSRPRSTAPQSHLPQF